MEEIDDGRDVKARLNPVTRQELQNTRHRDAASVLAPGEPSDRLAAIAQFVGFVIGIERKRDRAAGALECLCRRLGRRAHFGVYRQSGPHVGQEPDPEPFQLQAL